MSSPGGTRTPDRLLVREQPSPLGHRTMLLLSGLTGLAPRSLACDASIFLLDDEPVLRSGSRETRTHKRLASPPVFKTGSSSEPDDFRPVASCGSWNRTNGLLVQSQASLPTATVPQWLLLCSTTRMSCMVRSSSGEGIEPTPPGSKPGSLPLADYPAICKSALRESNPPASDQPSVGARSLEPLPLGQEHVVSSAEGEGVEPSRLIARPLSKRLPSPIGLPFRFMFKSCGGRNRTCVRAVNSRLPVPARVPPQSFQVRMAGFEPAISCSRSTRNARLSHTLRSRAPSGNRTHTSAMARQ